MKAKLLSLILILVWMAGWNASQAGSIVTAKCDNCGYDSVGLFLFGGKANFKTVCKFPACCTNKKVLVLVNLMADKLESEACPGQIPVAYTDPQMIQYPGTKTIASWNLPEPKNIQIRLTDGDYFCPNCGKFRLHFRHSG
ncbi:MAG: hypothetical protein AB1558_10945, partial [Thermodesulfobacteriota bacterium]